MKKATKAKTLIGANIDFVTSDSIPSTLSLLASPKNIIPEAFEKHTIAIVPTNANEAIDITNVTNKLISLAGIPNNMPAYNKNSLTNPLNGGKPEIATDPSINKNPVTQQIITMSSF